jgi:oligoendopeptidase F
MTLIPAAAANADAPSSAAGVRWNLADLYSGPEDPRIREDAAGALEQARNFESDYRGRVAGLTAAELGAAMARREALAVLAYRPLIHAQLLHAADSADPRHGALLAAAREQHSEFRNTLLFFDLEWLALEEPRAQALLADPALARYRHSLAVARMEKPHTLSEPEERVLNLAADTGRHAFQRLFDELVAGLTCRVDGAVLTLEQALSRLHLPDGARRKAAAEAVTEALRGQERTLALTLNTLLRDHADQDRLRRRPHAMHARNLENETDQATVDALLDACDRGMPLAQRYYRLKARLLGVERLVDHDRYAPIGAEPSGWPYARACQLVLEAYGDFSPRLADLARAFMERGWIDAEPRPGKAGGAFCASTVPALHPYLLLNYTDTPRDVATLAHELGHGVHACLAADQGFFQASPPLTLAETASVFGEMLAFRRMLAEQPEARLALLCSKLEDMFLTVLRQAALTRCEQELHRLRREQGELEPAAIGRVWLDANRRMYGDAVELSAGYSHWWSYISHFVHTPFYCYAYSFGELLVLALYRRYEEQGQAFVPGYLKLLEAGGSAPPRDLLRPLGVDIADPGFWDQGVALLEDWLRQAEALAEATLAARTPPAAGRHP